MLLTEDAEKPRASSVSFLRASSCQQERRTKLGLTYEQRWWPHHFFETRFGLPVHVFVLETCMKSAFSRNKVCSLCIKEVMSDHWGGTCGHQHF